MSDDNKNMLTQEGFDKIKAELEERKTTVRTEIANKLELATEQGDLSENAAYKSALEEKELNENKIESLETMLTTAKIIEADKDKSKVGLGDTVDLKMLKTGKKMKVSIVGHSEASPAESKISVESPLGKSIYSAKKGDTVTVELPTGTIDYKVEKIS